MTVETYSREFANGFFFTLRIVEDLSEVAWTLGWPNRPERFTPAVTVELALAVMDWRRTCLQGYINRHGHEIVIEHLSADRGWHSLQLRPDRGPRPLDLVIVPQTDLAGGPQ